MAVPAATYQTFAQVGRREDLSGMIYDISPTEKPFTSAVKKTKATQSKHEWQTDALASASATNAIAEGDDFDATVATAGPTVRLANQLQTLRKNVIVSGRARKIDTAGRADEFEYQLKKRMSEIGRDLEASLCQNNGATAGSAASAPLMASFESWICSSATAVGNYISAGTGTAQTTIGINAAAGYPIGGPTDSTVAGTLTEAMLKYVIRECWNKGGEPSMVVVGADVKQKISGGFTGIATRFRNVNSGSQAEIISGADLYVSDFGEIKIVPSRFSRARTVLVLDPQYLGIASLRGFTMERLAKTGDSDKAQIVGDYTLEVRNVLAHGKISDVDGTL
jgi:hypothetical protein